MDPTAMRQILNRLSICGSADRDLHCEKGITHLIVVANPGAVASKPVRFHGAFLSLYFGDVVSEADAKLCKTRPPTKDDILRAIELFREAWRVTGSKILVSCDYGASRSPALAYLFIADVLGNEQEADALKLTLELCPGAVPNGMVVRLGDKLLERRGALLETVRKLYNEISAELSLRPLRE
jgi:predicted protein tyrosine phosphatase